MLLDGSKESIELFLIKIAVDSLVFWGSELEIHDFSNFIIEGFIRKDFSCVGFFKVFQNAFKVHEIISINLQIVWRVQKFNQQNIHIVSFLHVALQWQVHNPRINVVLLLLVI